MARIDVNGKLLWSHASQSKGNVYNFALTTDSANCAYVMGIFEDTLTFQKAKLIPVGRRNMFILKIDMKGKVLWSSVMNAQLSNNLADNLGFEGLLDDKGKIISFRSVSLTGLDDPFKILVNSGGGVYFRLRLPSEKPELDSLLFEKGDEFSVIKWLVQENSRLIKANYNQSITGLLSVINLLNAKNISISSEIISEVVKKQNIFKVSENKASLEEIDKISSVKNSGGIVSMETVDNSSLKFGSLLLDSDCHFLLMEEPKTERIQVLSGMKILSFPDSYNMNYIIIDKYTGEILFDYDDHYKKKMPIHHDVIL